MSVRNTKDFLSRELLGEWREYPASGTHGNLGADAEAFAKGTGGVPDPFKGVIGFRSRGIPEEMVTALTTLFDANNIPYAVNNKQLELTRETIELLRHNPNGLKQRSKLEPRENTDLKFDRHVSLVPRSQRQHFDTIAARAAHDAGIKFGRGRY